MSLRDRFNVWHRGIHLAVALIDACPLRCPSCSVGNRWVGSGERMNFDLFRRILEKVDRETKVRSFTPHIWGEPLLHPELPAFLHEAKRRGYPHVVASTTLNKMNCKLRDVMQSGLDELVVSWSGWDNYGKHHKGGRIGVVLTNMEWLSAVKGSARVTIRFHKYKDNLHEVDKARSFSQSLGFTFTEVNAYYVNLENRVYGTLSAIDRETMQTFVEDVDTIAERHAGVDYCPLQSKHLAINADGRVQLCCQTRDKDLTVGEFLVVPLKHIRQCIEDHPFCVKCKAAGVCPLYRIVPESSADRRTVGYKQ